MCSLLLLSWLSPSLLTNIVYVTSGEDVKKKLDLPLLERI